MIFYFSGTGNSAWVARRLAEGQNEELLSIVMEIGDRDKAWGKRLDIPAGTAVRFEPGEKRTVSLIDMGGKRRVFGFNDKVDGYLDNDNRGLDHKLS